MADDFQLWWDTSRSSYDGETTPAAPISTTLWSTQNAILANPNMRSDWNQPLLRGQEDDFKQINRAGFSEDFGQTSSTATSPINQTWGFRVADSASVRVLLSEFQQSQQLGYSSSYPLSGYESQSSTPLPLWNASPLPAAAVDDACSATASFFPALEHDQISDEKVKITSEVRNLGAATKKNNAETTNKRARVRVEAAASPLPAAFKVRKEKMGDRITALQQLVSPFGKTDTASVLSEAIEYIKFLHDQVGALSSPYNKNGAPAVQKYEKSEDEGSSDGEVLASRGLCLVPVSSTFPVTHETTVDFWTPTFAFR